jgi:hypothetical protein
MIREMGWQATGDVPEEREGLGTHEWLTAGTLRPSESSSFLLRASVRRHRSAQGDRSTLRSIRPKRASYRGLPPPRDRVQRP